MKGCLLTEKHLVGRSFHVLTNEDLQCACRIAQPEKGCDGDKGCSWGSIFFHVVFSCVCG